MPRAITDTPSACPDSITTGGKASIPDRSCKELLRRSIAIGLALLDACWPPVLHLLPELAGRYCCLSVSQPSATAKQSLPCAPWASQMFPWQPTTRATSPLSFTAWQCRFCEARCPAPMSGPETKSPDLYGCCGCRCCRAIAAQGGNSLGNALHSAKHLRSASCKLVMQRHATATSPCCSA